MCRGQLLSMRNVLSCRKFELSGADVLKRLRDCDGGLLDTR